MQVPTLALISLAYFRKKGCRIGFSAPQGCGKTTLVFALSYLFQTTGRKSATLSIDDFYLTAEGQFRGNAGSHDLPFSIETLSALSKQKKAGKSFLQLSSLHFAFLF
ncbi:D-glycerate 3-kinase [Populus alba x Populus x berolinensis]|uniref:D-glycerate 3-kinase n=1 Tax=Populus alba x Populus x berolinensis TaxID=444605 RepID=A0AAD6RMQ9_9ROSI|nr:D-glycerate 3-kinase [Populus alba x Populus x berolinensis]